MQAKIGTETHDVLVQRYVYVCVNYWTVVVRSSVCFSTTFQKRGILLYPKFKRYMGYTLGNYAHAHVLHFLFTNHQPIWTIAPHFAAGWRHGGCWLWLWRHGSMSACQRQTCSQLLSFIADQWSDVSSQLLDRPAIAFDLDHTQLTFRVACQDSEGRGSTVS